MKTQHSAPVRTPVQRSASDELTARFCAWNKVYQELVLAEHILACVRQEGDLAAWQETAARVAQLRRRSEELLAEADELLASRDKRPQHKR